MKIKSKAAILLVIMTTLFLSFNMKKIKSKDNSVENGFLYLLDAGIEIKIDFSGNNNNGVSLGIKSKDFMKFQLDLQSHLDITQFITSRHQGVFESDTYVIPFCKIEKIHYFDEHIFIIDLNQNFKMKIFFKKPIQDLRIKVHQLRMVKGGTITIKDDLIGEQTAEIKTKYTFRDSSSFHIKFDLDSSTKISNIKKYIDNFNQKITNIKYPSEYTVELSYLKSIRDDPNNELRSILIFKNENNMTIEVNILKSTTINLRKYASIYLDAEPGFNSTYIQIDILEDNYIQSSWGFTAQYRSENLTNNIFGFDLIIYRQNFMDRQELLHNSLERYLNIDEALAKLCQIFNSFNSIIERPANYYIALTKVYKEISFTKLNSNYSKIAITITNPSNSHEKFLVTFPIANAYINLFRNMIKSHNELLYSIAKSIERKDLFCIERANNKCQDFENPESSLCLNTELAGEITNAISPALENPILESINDNTVKFASYLCDRYSTSLNDNIRNYEKIYAESLKEKEEAGFMDERKDLLMAELIDGMLM